MMIWSVLFTIALITRWLDGHENQKGEGPDVRPSSPSIQLRPSRTRQHVTLNKRKGLVMKKTIRRT